VVSNHRRCSLNVVRCAAADERGGNNKSRNYHRRDSLRFTSHYLDGNNAAINASKSSPIRLTHSVRAPISMLRLLRESDKNSSFVGTRRCRLIPRSATTQLTYQCYARKKASRSSLITSENILPFPLSFLSSVLSRFLYALHVAVNFGIAEPRVRAPKRAHAMNERSAIQQVRWRRDRPRSARIRRVNNAEIPSSRDSRERGGAATAKQTRVACVRPDAGSRPEIAGCAKRPTITCKFM